MAQVSTVPAVSPVKVKAEAKETKASADKTTATASKRPVLPSIKTPQSDDSMLPSELPRSPVNKWTLQIKNEDDMKTPITPPSAYTDFLKALSPAISTPATANSMRSCFSFTDTNGHLTPITQPQSATSTHYCTSEKRKALPASAVSAPLVPPSPFVRPTFQRTGSSSGRTSTLRKLRIPQSAGCGPNCNSPKIALPSPMNITELRSPFSPTSWYIDGQTRSFETPKSSGPTAVSVKQVVTRTVTYTRTPLEPAPKGKRRKIE